MGLLTTEDLFPAELEVVSACAAGTTAVLAREPGGARPAVRADLIRQLLLELPVGDGVGSAPWPIRLSGVRIEGARIVGALDLNACSGPDGRGLPSLALRKCEIAEPLDLSFSRIVRLSLEGSEIREVRLVGLQVDSSIDISYVRPAPAAHGEAETAFVDAARCMWRRNSQPSARTSSPQVAQRISPSPGTAATPCASPTPRSTVRCACRKNSAPSAG